MKPTPKLFSAEEANRLLPEVRELLREMRRQRDQVEELEKKKAVEQLAWLEPDGSVSARAQEGIQRLEELQQSSAAVFKKSLERLSTLGAQLKDLDQGLVDFFTARGKDLAYLCWKDGEDRIRFWHDLESGFAGRRPLEDL